MNIKEINTHSRRDVNKFVDFAYDLYAECPYWSPPLRSSMRMVLNRDKHPFYKHSDAAFYIAEENGKVLGRVMVLDNHHYNTFNETSIGFIYYFDAENRDDVAVGLFAAAEAWAKARGLTELMGPKGMMRADPYGVLIEGFEYTAALSMPYNYPYYPDLMTAAGFTKQIDYVSGFMRGDLQLPDRMYSIAERVKKRSGFSVKSFNSKRELRQWIPAIQKINNEAFVNVWGYYPIDDEEVAMIGQTLLTIADPRLLKLVLKDDEIIGFAFIFPDITKALQETRGRMWPFGWIKLLRAIRTTRILSGNGVGLLPEYQGLGATAVLYTEFAKTVYQRKATHCDVAQAMETNFKSLGDMNALGVTWHKRHRVYRKTID